MENLFVEVAKHSYVLYLPLLRSTGYKVWQQIPSEMQEVLKPHFNSRLVYIYVYLCIQLSIAQLQVLSVSTVVTKIVGIAIKCMASKNICLVNNLYKIKTSKLDHGTAT